MVARRDLIARARSWVGTRFRHQGRQPGVGLDCIGVLVCLAREFDLLTYDQIGYPRLPQGDLLLQHIEAAGCQLRPGAAAQPGDVLVFRIKRDPQHVGLMTDHGVLHALLEARKVVEHRLDELWSERLMAAYSLPGVEPTWHP